MKTIYDFKALDIKGNERSLSEFSGRPILIVNTASKCGFTPQYKDLQELYKSFEGQVEVLGFPCNQFGAQEPGADEEIQSFCDLTFNVTFPLFSKVDVNGDDAHPLYQFLKESLPGILGSKAVKWNFTKFLVDKNGVPVKRYAPQVKPSEIINDIKELL